MARLTEQEQQEVIRYIEADKPLPDRYRFLLFEDKREVELVWNGKTGKTSEHAKIKTVVRCQSHKMKLRAEERKILEKLGLFDTVRRWAARMLDQEQKTLYGQDVVDITVFVQEQ